MRIGVVTVGRSDYGIYTPVLEAMKSAPALDFYLLVSGMHLSEDFGLTVRDIETDGFPIGNRIPVLEPGDAPVDIARSIARGVAGFGAAFSERRPDMLMVLGDRFEMYSAALAALPFNIPVIHIHGGELTQGAMDDALRHSMTKLSHLHFASTEEYARRIRQLGEEAWRVTVSGAPSLDNLRTIPLLSVSELKVRYNLDAERSPLLVTFHPATLETDIAGQAERFIAALAQLEMPAVVTMPNSDTHGRIIREQFREFAGARPHIKLIENLGAQGYFSLMSRASVMVGNSSSGIIEAASFKLPVVNVGSRQAGRLRPRNVIDVDCVSSEIVKAVQLARSDAFRDSLDGLENPYGDGRASERIVHRLSELELSPAFIKKQFSE